MNVDMKRGLPRVGRNRSPPTKKPARERASLNNQSKILRPGLQVVQATATPPMNASGSQIHPAPPSPGRISQRIVSTRTMMTPGGQSHSRHSPAPWCPAMQPSIARAWPLPATRVNQTLGPRRSASQTSLRVVHRLCVSHRNMSLGGRPASSRGGRGCHLRKRKGPGGFPPGPLLCPYRTA